MSNHAKIVIFFSVLLGVGGVFFGYSQHQENEQRTKQLATVEQKQRAVQDAYNQAKLDVEALKTTLADVQTKENNPDGEYDAKKAYQDQVNDLFTTLFNYTPDNFSARKERGKAFLSEELMKDYFSNKQTYSDANGVTSQLKEIKIFTQTVQGTELNGLVMVKYESKVDGSSWTKGMNLFEVTYDPPTKKVTKIQNLGSGFTGDMLQ